MQYGYCETQRPKTRDLNQASMKLLDQTMQTFQFRIVIESQALGLEYVIQISLVMNDSKNIGQLN